MIGFNEKVYVDSRRKCNRFHSRTFDNGVRVSVHQYATERLGTTVSFTAECGAVAFRAPSELFPSMRCAYKAASECLSAWRRDRTVSMSGAGFKVLSVMQFKTGPAVILLGAAN
jgi:hypothetical protein